MDINIKIDGQIARITNTAEICSGNVKVNGLAFEFSSEWDEFPTKTAVIYVDDYDKKTATNVLIEDNRVDADLLPADLFKKKCVLYVGVIGSNDNEQRITSTVVGQRIKKGTPTDAVQLVDIDIFTQIIAIMNETKNVCDSAIHAVDSNIKYMQRAEEASNQASKSADKAVQAVDRIDASVEKAKVSEQNAKTSENNALATKKSIDEVMADYDYLMGIENFRMKVIQVLKEKGISIDEDAKLDDVMVKAIEQGISQTMLEYLKGNTTVFINNELTTLLPNAFNSLKILTKARMDNVVVFGTGCFNDCSSLKNVRFDNLTTANGSNFLTNTPIKNLVLPKLVGSFGNSSLNGCHLLKRVVLPRYESYMDWGGAVLRSTALDLADLGKVTSVGLLQTVKTIILRRNSITSLTSSNNILNVVEIYVPQDLIESYKVATNWTTYADKFKPLERSKYEPLNWYEEEEWYKEEMKVWG